MIAGPTVVVPLQSGGVVGHQLTDGTHVWTTDLAAEKPLVADAERVYIIAGEALHALDARTGAVRWRTPIGGSATAAPLARAGWILVAAVADLLAIRATDGHIIWRQRVGAIEFRPAIDGDLLVAPIVEGRVLALDVATGSERWRTELGSAPTEPLVIGGRVYVGTQDKSFYALRASSGVIDYPRFVGARVMGRAAADDRHIYFTALDNVLYAVDRGHGAIKWKAPLVYRPTGGPVVLGLYVVVPGQVDSLPAFEARTGAAASRIVFPASLARLPLLTPAQDAAASAIGITGNLEGKWVLSMFGPLPVSSVPLVPLTELPGEPVTLPAEVGIVLGER